MAENNTPGYVPTDPSAYKDRKPKQTLEQFLEKYKEWIGPDGKFRGDRANGGNGVGDEEYTARNGIENGLNGKDARQYYLDNIGFQKGRGAATEFDSAIQDTYNDEVDASYYHSVSPGEGGMWKTPALAAAAMLTAGAAYGAAGASGGAGLASGSGGIVGETAALAPGQAGALNAGATGLSGGTGLTAGAGGVTGLTSGASAVPGLASMGGGTGLTTLAAGGGTLSAAGVTAAGLTLGDVALQLGVEPSAFSTLMQAGKTVKDAYSALKGVAAAAAIFGGGSALSDAANNGSSTNTTGATPTNAATGLAPPPSYVSTAVAPGAYKPTAVAPTMIAANINNPYANSAAAQSVAASTTAAKTATANPSVKQYVDSLDWSAAGTPASVEKLKTAMKEYGVDAETVAASAGYPLADVQKLLGISPANSTASGPAASGAGGGASVSAAVMGVANGVNPYSSGGSAGTAADKAYSDWVTQAPVLKAQADQVGARGDKIYNQATGAASELRDAARSLRNDPALKKYREYADNLGTQGYEDQKVGQSLADVSQQANAAMAGKRRSDAARGFGNRASSNADALQIAGMKAQAASGARYAAKDAWGNALGKSTQMDVAQGELSNKYDNTALGYGNQAAGAATMGLDAGLKYGAANNGALTSIQNADSTRRQAGASETSAGASAMNASTNAWKAQADDRYNWGKLSEDARTHDNTYGLDLYKANAQVDQWGVSNGLDLYKTNAQIDANRNTFAGNLYDSSIRKAGVDNNFSTDMYRIQSGNTQADANRDQRDTEGLWRGVGWTVDNAANGNFGKAWEATLGKWI